MARASHVAYELGSCWAESWAAHRARLDAADQVKGATADPERVPAAPAELADVEFTDIGLSDVELAAASDALTADEADMLTLAAYGLSNEEIARSTRFSRQTVAWHLSRLMRSWRAPNRTALVAVAFVRGALVARAPRQAHRSKNAALPPAPPSAAPAIDTNSTAPTAVPDTTDAAEAS
jgi:DNA-binding CsgD family transcriptional regulator